MANITNILDYLPDSSRILLSTCSKKTQYIDIYRQHAFEEFEKVLLNIIKYMPSYIPNEFGGKNYVELVFTFSSKSGLKTLYTSLFHQFSDNIKKEIVRNVKKEETNIIGYEYIYQIIIKNRYIIPYIIINKCSKYSNNDEQIVCIRDRIQDINNLFSNIKNFIYACQCKGMDIHMNGYFYTSGVSYIQMDHFLFNNRWTSLQKINTSLFDFTFEDYIKRIVPKPLNNPNADTVYTKNIKNYKHFFDNVIKKMAPYINIDTTYKPLMKIIYGFDQVLSA